MKRVLYWFRTDLRLHDSPAMQAALDLKPDEFWPIWCWDPHYVKYQRVGSNRWRFLLDSMNNVSESITKLNAKSKLFVIRGSPMTTLPELFKLWKITHLVFERDDCPYTKERDQTVMKAAKSAGVEVIDKLGHTLFWAGDVVKANKGHAPLSYGGFTKLVEGMPEPAKPLPPPHTLPDPGTVDLKGFAKKHQGLDRYSGIDNNAESRDGDDNSYESFAGPDGDFSVPTMDELGMQPATSSFRGGETRALEILEKFLQDEAYVAAFEKPKSDPSAFDPASTTQLSPYLKFGCLSCRTFFHRLQDVYKKYPKHSKPPVSLVGQLYWRDFFHTAMFATPNWHQMRGNPVSRYMDWRLENQYDNDGKILPRDQWEVDEQEQIGETLFQAWRLGRTGYPWIDACMRQLKQDGWIHHLSRHAVACFLTRGHCFVSWERGQDVFDEFLVDWDPAMNGGNWMWLSCTAFFSQYYRVYSPVAFGKKQKNSEAYVKRWVPEVADFPDKYLFEPWKAPMDVQKKAKCIIGEDYPRPVVSEGTKTHVIDKIKKAYEVHLQGNDPSVLDGSAKRRLRDALPLEVPKPDDEIDVPEHEPPSSPNKRKAVTQSEDDARKYKQTKLAF